MAGIFSKIFGKKKDEAPQTPSSPTSEAEHKLAEIRNEVMNLESKGRAINTDMERLRLEIRQKEQENQQLMDEYESLDEGLEKEMVLGRLAAYEEELDGLRNRVEDFSKAWRDNAKLIQIMKRARARLQAALSAGCSPSELAGIIHDVTRLGEGFDIGVDVVEDAGSALGGTTADCATEENRKKALARLAARKGAKVSSASQKRSDAPTHRVETAEHPSCPMTASLS